MSLQSGSNDKSKTVHKNSTPVTESAVQENSAPAIDAVIKVSIKDSGLNACVRITPPSNGGADAAMDVLMKVLNDSGIKNIDLMKLKSLVSSPVYDEDIVVAAGMAAIPGDDGTMEFLVRTTSDGKPKEYENGTIDYRDLGLIQNVTAGQVLCVLTPPTEGKPGFTVKGETIKPKPGKPAPVTAGPNTLLSPDGLQIISKINGQFEFDGKKLIVSETYTLNHDVDTSTGNIKVAGNLVVRGMVASGFTLEAGGYINVTGVVESSTITAGKDIFLQGGANGSTISCGGNFKCRFIENCDVFVKGDMKAEYILNSNVRCRKSLKTEGVISKIMGGTCVVRQNLEARIIGSAAGVKTKLEIGNDPELVDRQHYLTDQIREIERQLQSLEPLLKLLRQLEAASRLTEEKAQMLEKASFSHKAQTEALEGAKSELEEISNVIANKNFGKVICTGIIYPGTFVTIGSANYTVTQNLMNSSLYYRDGEISIGAAR